ncbi:MAG: DUF3106 domain-containing protein [Burkholderiales bacterium]|nr:DUF3106 domain-containing protein [Burkholderiales bacterium]
MVKTLAALILGLSISFASLAAPPGRAPQWDELSPQQRAVLAPVASQWNNFPEFQKRRLLGVAKRFPQLTPIQQKRVQSRLREWSRLTPEERSQARKNFRSLKKLPPDQRKAVKQKWLHNRESGSGHLRRHPKAHPAPIPASGVPPTTTSPAK